MKTITQAAITILLASALLNNATAINHEDLAYHHAPVHYQDSDSSDYKSDYITAINYDADWVSTNNWDNLNQGQWPATVYYSVAETCTHYFITYSFFHPRDWSDTAFDQEHENDLEGALFSVRKDQSTFGTLEGMVTVFHSDFYSYKNPESSLSNGHESIDGTISFEWVNDIPRAMTVQEAKGHGLKAWPYTSDFDGGTNQDGIIYYPVKTANDFPQSGNDRYVEYRLENVFADNGLWSQALREAEQPNQTFSGWGTFKGDNSGNCGSGWKSCSTNSANTPWGWDDSNDGDSFRGEFALDPSHLFDHYFDGLESFSHQYLSNKYITGLLNSGYDQAHTPNGFPSQLNLGTLSQRFTEQCPA